jgi:hypothetical protein
MPLTLEGRPGQCAASWPVTATAPPAMGALGASRAARPVRAGTVIVGALRRGLAACGERGQLTGGSAAPGGLPLIGRGRLPPRSRRVPLLPPAGFWQLSSHARSRFPSMTSASPASDPGPGTAGPARRGALLKP